MTEICDCSNKNRKMCRIQPYRAVPDPGLSQTPVNPSKAPPAEMRTKHWSCRRGPSGMATLKLVGQNWESCIRKVARGLI